MASITLIFSSEINSSVQVGDTAYYCKTSTEDGFETADNNITLIGLITSIVQDTNTIVCNADPFTASSIPSNNSFIMFSKDNAVNMSSPLGYFGQAKFVNDSTIKGEIFATACDIEESSK